MDRTSLRQHLALTEKHVSMGEEHLARQKELIAELEGNGHDSTQARHLLRLFERSQELHVADRNRLRDELAR